jgi:glycosyltransferase involved in cell wall biosynthesis
VLQMLLAIFIPAYEAEATIAQVIGRIPSAVYQIVEEILVQDDGSHDDTVRVATEISERYAKVTVVENDSNLGYGGTLKKAHAYLTDRGYDAYAMLHGDLQYDPEDLREILRPIISGHADIVLGSRMSKDSYNTGMPCYKRLGNRFLTMQMNRRLRLNLTDYHTGSVAVNCRSLADITYDTLGDGHEFTAQLLIRAARAGLRIVETPVHSNYDAGSRSCSALTSLVYGLRVLGMLQQARAESLRGQSLRRRATARQG